MFNQEEPDTAAMKSGNLRILHTMDTDVVVLAVRLIQEMYEVVDELKITDMFSCINLSGTRGKQQCEKLD